MGGDWGVVGSGVGPLVLGSGVCNQAPYIVPG